jgi:hypothetical protein
VRHGQHDGLPQLLRAESQPQPRIV